MSVNAFILQFCLVFLPGLLWARMHSVFVAKEKDDALEFFVSTLFYGLISYLAVFSVYAIVHAPFVFARLEEADKQSVISAPVAIEIGWALAAAFVLGLLNIYASTYRLMYRFLHLVKATKRYGSEDVWDFTLNARSVEVEYAHVRDFDNKLVYAGWINAFSETGKLRELTLRDVQVFDFDGNLYYEIPRLYLARKPEGVHIEFPQQPATGAKP